MKNNNKDLQQNIVIDSNKYLLIGFVIGIIPFMIMLSILSINTKGIEFVPKIFRNTILVCGLIVSFTNAIVFKKIATKK